MNNLDIINNKKSLVLMAKDFFKLFFYSFAFGDPLLSASNKSGQKCLSAHFAISKNTSLRSVLPKFEAEPNLLCKAIYL